MKTIFLSTLIILSVYFAWAYVLEPFKILYLDVDNAFDRGDFQEAKMDCEGILHLHPSLFRQSANQQIGKTHVLAAQAALGNPNPDFEMALAWLRGLINRTGEEPTGSEDLANQMIQALPKEHLHYARDILFYEKEDYQKALLEFSRIGIMYQGWPEIQKEALFFKGICHVKLAQSKLLHGYLEESLYHFTSLLKSPDVPPLLIEREIAKVPNVTEETMRANINSGRYVNAFRVLDFVRENLPHPMVVEKLARMKEKFEKEIFEGSPIGDEYINAAIPVKIADIESGASIARLLVRNEFDFPVKILYRGLISLTVELKPGTEQEIELLPGEYLMAIFPQNEFKSKTYRGELLFQPGKYRQVAGL